MNKKCDISLYICKDIPGFFHVYRYKLPSFPIEKIEKVLEAVFFSEKKAVEYIRETYPNKTFIIEDFNDRNHALFREYIPHK